MALNLVRNSKVFFTTNVNATTGVINASSTAAFTATNTFEIQVLEGFTFSQNLNNETVTISEAGTAPVRGQRSFNTSLAPVDFSFSTYIRPRNQTTKITAEESLLWNALMADTAIATASSITGVTTVAMATTGMVTLTGTAMAGLPVVNDTIVLSGVASTTPAGYDKYLNSAGVVKSASATVVTIQLINFNPTAVTAAVLTPVTTTLKYTKCAWNESNTAYSQLVSGVSDRNQLQKFGLLFLVDNVMYAVDNCALNQVTVDFGLDQIATAQWTGQATALRQFATGITAGAGSFANGTTADVGASGAFTAKDTSANFITNKLTTIDLKSVRAIGSAIPAATSYTVPITGGSITINNNITYITPAVLGIVNNPVTYFTGTRSISGNLTAYLKTGTTGETGELLADMLAETANSIEPMFALSINIGGAANTVKVVMEMPAATIGVPSVDVQQVVSANIAFTAQGYAPSATAANNAFDLTQASDLLVRYYA